MKKKKSERDYKHEYALAKSRSKQWKVTLNETDSKALQKVLERRNIGFSEWIRERIRLAK